MAWYILDVNSWSQFEGSLNVAGNPGSMDAGLFYRGQADADWGLVDSLTRHLGPEVPIEKALEIEKVALRKFKEQAHFFSDAHTLPRKSSGHSLLEPFDAWWGLMQHFGAPTRLLDWTVSPYVAAYFAVVDRLDSPGTVWVFPESDLRKASLDLYSEHFSKFPKKPGESVYESVDSPQFLLPTEHGQFPNVRMITQQSRFTLPGRILSNHGILIGQLLDGKSSRKNIRINIKAEAKPEILKKLMQLNITANTLFPGLDGLGRSIREYISIARKFA